MMPETFSRSLWSALAPPGAHYDPLAGDIETEVAVVGSGFLGLSTALHLAEAGRRVVLLEAEEPGFGASGRNTGFVVPSLRTGLGPADVRALVGEAGERLMRLVGASGDAVFDLVARHGIDCSAERTGWLQPAHTPAMLEILRQREADWQGLGRKVDILTAAETARKVGADHYPGALFDPTGGQLNPLAYARGLARAATAAGVTIHASTPVVGIDTGGARPLVRTARGNVVADRVLLTTNALVGDLCPEVATSIVPVRVFQIATQRLEGEAVANILPDRTPVADTRRHTLAVRWSPDNRLVTGGMVLPGSGRFERAKTVFLRRMERLYPALPPLRAEYVWTGVIAATLDSMPRFMHVRPNVDAAIGCNGRGVALTTALAERIAALYSGMIGEEEFPLPCIAPQRIGMHPLVRHGPTLWLPWSNLRDRLDTGRAM